MPVNRLRHTLLSLTLLALPACAPITVNLPATATSTTPASVALTCAGHTYGTFTSASAQLTLNVKTDGTAQGIFTNNGTLFQASGQAPLRLDGSTLVVQAVTLALDSRVQGSAAASANLLRSFPVGLSGTYGSTGTLSATLTGTALTGTFKGLQGTYRLVMTCT